MSTSIDEGVSANETGGETHSLTSHEPADVNNASSSLSTPVTSEEVATQIKAAVDPLNRQLERPPDLMKDLRQVPPSRNEKTTGSVLGPSRPYSIMFISMQIQVSVQRRHDSFLTLLLQCR